MREELIQNEELEEVRSDFFDRVQKKYIPLREPNTEYFDKEEILLIDQILSRICNANATEISDFSHTFLAWQVAEHMEELPYFTFLLTSRTPTQAEIDWALGEISSYNVHNN